VKVWFEVEVTTPDGKPQTLAQQQFTMQFEVNEEDDEPPAAAAASAATAAAQAAIATTQANNASACLTAIQNAAGNFLGLVAGNAVPNTASTPTAGKYYIISSAGTSQSITWSFGDWAIYNGTSGSWSRLPAGVMDATSVAQIVNPRAARQAVVFDGTNYATFAGVAAFGTNNFSVSTWARIDTHANHSWLVACGLNGGGFGFWATASTIGVDSVSAVGVGSVSLALPVGEWAHYTYTRNGTVGTLYVNGLSVATWTDATSYGTASSSFGGNVDYKWAGAQVPPVIFNRALSAAEVLTLHKGGAAAASDYAANTNDAGATVYAGGAMLNGANSTFASDSGFWSKAGTATISGGVASFPAISDRIYKVGFWKKNLPYLVTITTTGSVKIHDGTTTLAILAGGTTAIQITPTANDLHVEALSAGATADNFTLTPCGLILAPDAQQNGIALTWYDVSGNGANITLPATGAKWRLPWSGIAGTNTNDNARAGTAGEYISSSVTSGAALSLSTGTAANITSISLTPGDWDVDGSVGFVPAGGSTLAYVAGGVGTTSATVIDGQDFVHPMSNFAPSVNPIGVTPVVRISVSATTTVYLVAQASFAVGTLKGFGTIRARRVR
jgi:hypothetical protein